MSSDNNAKSFSLWVSLGYGLLSGSFTMGLLYMVDWKQESVLPFYQYLLGVILIAASIPVTQALILWYRRRKK